MSKKVLITGASRGLGYFLAKKFLEEGWTVYAGVRDPASQRLGELSSTFSRLTVLKLDVSSTRSVLDCAEQFGKKEDSLDILINNAGVQALTSFNSLEGVDLDDALNIYNVNALGSMRVVKAFLPLLKQSSSLIANISSGAGSITGINAAQYYDYCMSKAALNMGTKILHNQLKDTGINVLAVDPGWLDTDMGKRSGGYMDPYESACRLYALFSQIDNGYCGPIFIDNEGKGLQW